MLIKLTENIITYYNKFQLKNKNSHRTASISKGDIRLKHCALTYY